MKSLDIKALFLYYITIVRDWWIPQNKEKNEDAAEICQE